MGETVPKHFNSLSYNVTLQTEQSWKHLLEDSEEGMKECVLP